MTPQTILKRTVAGTAIAISALAGTLSVSALAAGEASASVNSGRYLMAGQGVGLIASKTIVTVQGNRLKAPGAPDLILHPTRNGAYADSGITRYTFIRKGNGYVGHIVVGPVQVATYQLIRR